MTSSGHNDYQNFECSSFPFKNINTKKKDTAAHYLSFSKVFREKVD